MTKIKLDKIIEDVLIFYLESGDFNGLPVRDASKLHNIDMIVLKELVNSGDIDLHFGYPHPNPHVKALPLGNQGQQLKMLEQIDEKGISDIVMYPSVGYLSKNVSSTNYAGKPFTLMLALGMPQLELLYFEPRILKYYRDDPRYSYNYQGAAGRISVTSEADDSDDFPVQDKVFIETFGTGFSNDYENDWKTAIVTFPRYLHNLSPEHQQMWQQKILDSSRYRPEYAFYASQILGPWEYKVSMYDAIVAEMKYINQMARAMNGKPLFKNDYSSSSDIPRTFHRLLMPTRKEFQDFAEVLDIMLSDNLNRNFFKQAMPYEVKSGEIGSIALLEEWFYRSMNAPDLKPIEQIAKAFRNVRAIRSKSSHQNFPDEFDYKYNQQHTELMRDAYTAIRTIRLAFTNHPAAKKVEIPDWLFKGDISNL